MKNWNHFVLGGIVAGVIINISGISLVYFVLGKAYVESFRSHLSESPGLSMMVTNLGMRMMFGFLAMYLYSVIVGSTSKGKSILISGCVLWLAAYLPLSICLNQFDILTGWQFWVAMLWGFAEICVAIKAGSTSM